MTRQSSNKLGVGIMFLVIVVAFMFITPFFPFGCSRVFLHDFLGMTDHSATTGVLMTNHGIARLVPLLVMFVLWAALSLWVYQDAERRGHSGLLWGLFVFVGNIIGLIIYFIVRSTALEPSTVPSLTATSPCPSCGKPTQKTFVACPYCGTNLAKKCGHCGKSAEVDWKVCPYCGKPIDDH